jgi:orotidine-5'-phosphate decarboxylase
MEHFADFLTRRMRETQSVACVGLDPRADWIPEHLNARDFCREVITAVRGKAAAIKPQLAFFDDEPVVPEDLALFAGEEFITIADAKRGDIGSTAEAYAERWLGSKSPCAALTVNPFLGRDSLEPLVSTAAKNGKGIFVLVKTSNPGSADLQDLELKNGERVFEQVARLVQAIGANHRGASGYSVVGAVVGATAKREVTTRLRELMPDAIFLMPGFGAQGGSADSIKAARGRDGGGVLVPSSRSLNFPWRPAAAPKDWRAAITKALEAMNKELAF